ncbi:FecR family protein [Pedobacter nutrimenti]|uniref:FecR family protein n=1 Tax=Pedobacter nutrimenti TaxID=1241337 RepID=UPI002931DEA7|nr:FecR domain-containing protein [Pedobacter nutrimenti]
MDSTHFRAAELISLFVQMQISEAELQELKNMITDFPELENWLNDRGLKMDEVEERLNYYHNLDKEVEWKLVLNKLERRESKRNNLKNWWAVAASILLAVIFGGLIFRYGTERKSIAHTALAAQKISPGKNMAVLTLSDGSKVLLDENSSQTIADGKTSLHIHNNDIAYSTGPDQEVHIHKLEVPRGGTYHIQLADGTKVWLNAESELEFPSAFTGKERIVSMKGEVYFEVAKDHIHPFKVRVNGTEVEAVGTAFNINTHLAGKRIKTILTEGRIKVRESGQSKIIDAGYEITSGQGDLQVKLADLEEALSWKDGYFYFDRKNLTDILGEVSRWYKVDIDVQVKSGNDRYRGGIRRSESIEAVCKVLSDLTGYRCVIEKNKLIVK